MKAKHLILSAVALGAASMFNACSLEPYEIPASEEYTRAFIKEFGLIDPSQDWNLAKAGTVTVNVGQKADNVKVYAKSGDKYYKVADLIGIKGEVTIPIDIPETCNDLIVKVGNKRYYTTVGGNVTCQTIKSRSVSTGTQTIAGQSITATAGAWNVFSTGQMTPITYKTAWPDYWSINGNGWRTNDDNSSGKVPEIGVGNQETGNTKNPGVSQNFTISAGESFTISPMYWQSMQTHTIGIFLVGGEGDGMYALKADGTSVMYH